MEGRTSCIPTLTNIIISGQQRGLLSQEAHKGAFEYNRNLTRERTVYFLIKNKAKFNIYTTVDLHNNIL